TGGWYVDAESPIDSGEQGRALAEGPALASFDHGGRKTVDPRPVAVERLVLAAPDGDGAIASAERSARVCGWVNRCRELVDAPGNELAPAALADAAVGIAAGLDGLTCEVWGPDEISDAGMGAFEAVARGSANTPRLITLRWEPAEALADVTLGLVGKAITFDTGGISIKPSARMADMKTDMGGGAAVLAGVGAIADLGIPVRVLAVIPSCENMPDGRSYRPGDVLTAKNGKTIEVTNTDAEGRLILADALTHCRELGATHLVDLATLTGACVVALGDFYAGLMGNDQEWVDEIESAAKSSGDHAWQLPLHDTYRRHIGSTFADLKNSSDLRQAGPIYAGSFLAEFSGEGPWAHLDIAGTASLDRGRGDYFTGAGATGYGVRLLADLAGSLATRGQ
ncbi:MAG: M17 family metallopeptidase, partial [Gaiellales bacterium]